MTQARHRPDTVPCESCSLRNKPAFRPLAEPEVEFLRNFKAGEMRVAAGSDLLVTGSSSAHLFTLWSGWAFRYVLLPDGGRQILNFALPGDLVGLQATVLEQMEHAVQALTDITLCVFERKRLWALYQEHPALGFDVTWLAAHEESLVDQSLASVGRRTARGRLAFLVLHLWRRQEGLGLISGGRCDFPLTQQHIADATGLSLVHTNRTLRRLVGQGLIELGGGRLGLPDIPALERLLGDAPKPTPPRPMI